MGPGGESHLAGAHCGARYRATRCGCNANICARSVSGHLLGKKVNQNDSCLFLNKLRLKFAYSVHIRVETRYLVLYNAWRFKNVEREDSSVGTFVFCSLPRWLIMKTRQNFL